MKKFIIIISILSAIVLAWCAINTDDISYTIKEYFAIDEIAGLFKNSKKEILQQQINFENDLKCQERWDFLMATYSGFHSIYYDTETNSCYAKYYSNNNIIKEASLDDIYKAHYNNIKEKQQTQQTTQYTIQQTSQSQTSNTNSQTNNAFCKTRLERYEEERWEYRYCLKEKEADPGSFKLCLQPIKPFSCY